MCSFNYSYGEDMKKILAVAALLATVVAPAFAQGVKSYYGAVDIGSLSYPGNQSR